MAQASTMSLVLSKPPPCQQGPGWWPKPPPCRWSCPSLLHVSKARGGGPSLPRVAGPVQASSMSARPGVVAQASPVSLVLSKPPPCQPGPGWWPKPSPCRWSCPSLLHVSQARGGGPSLHHVAGPVQASSMSARPGVVAQAFTMSLVLSKPPPCQPGPGWWPKPSPCRWSCPSLLHVSQARGGGPSLHHVAGPVQASSMSARPGVVAQASTMSLVLSKPPPCQQGPGWWPKPPPCQPGPGWWPKPPPCRWSCPSLLHVSQARGGGPSLHHVAGPVQASSMSARPGVVAQTSTMSLVLSKPPPCQQGPGWWPKPPPCRWSCPSLLLVSQARGGGPSLHHVAGPVQASSMSARPGVVAQASPPSRRPDGLSTITEQGRY